MRPVTGSREKSPRALLKALRRKQKKHCSLLSRVEKTAARLEQRRVKLTALEARIADLERRLSELPGDPERPAAGGVLRQAQLIFNPSSGRDKKNSAMRLAQVVSSLRAHGIQAHIGLKTSGKAARALAREAVRSGPALVVVAAGDGTLGDVASELVGTSTALGIVPIGTMNNVARSLGIPLEIDDACALIGMGTTRHIDMGRVLSNGKPHDEYFLDCAGLGLSAIAAQGGQAFQKRRWRALPPAIRKFFEAKLGTVQVEMDGTLVEVSTRIVTVSNAPLIANNLLAAPDAKMDDGFLDVALYDDMGNAALVKHFIAAASGSPEEIKTYRARRVRISAEEPLPVNSDMNITPARHVIEIEIVPKALTMIVGNGIGLTLPVESAPDAPTFAVDPQKDPESTGAAPEPARTDA